VNITDVKNELSSDEKVLENVFKLETLYKKYKFIIWALVVGLILFFVARAVMQNMNESKLLEANEAFLVLQTDENNGQALATLKEKNPKLFDLYSYSKAVEKEDTDALTSLANSSNEIIADASVYTQNTLSKTPKDSKLYNEIALFEQAYLAITKKDIKTAKHKLDLIGENSPLYTLATLLKHSTLKAQ